MNDDSYTSTPNEDRNHTISVAVATAVAAEAAVAAAQAAAKVVRLAGCKLRSKEERAATTKQSYYRGYLARRALCALRGLARLQALVRGYNVRKRARETMQCMQALVRVHARVRARRLYLTNEKLRKRIDKKDGEEKTRRMDELERKPKTPLKKHDVVMRRERALAYAYSYQYEQRQQQHQQLLMKSRKNIKDVGVYPNEREKAQ